MAHSKILDIKQTALVVIDLQEAFRSAISDFPEVASHASMAVRGFQILNVPVIVTEQYQKGLGKNGFQFMRRGGIYRKIKNGRCQTSRAVRS